MYFDDEKDYTTNQEDQDDVISWDTILDTDEDGIVSIKEDKSSALTNSNTDSVENKIPDINSIDLGDDLTIVNDDEIDDEDELKRIISSDDTEEASYDFENPKESNTGTSQEEYNAIEEDTEDITPRKEEISAKTNSPSPILIIILVILLLGGASYYIFTFVANKEDDDIPALNPEAQEQINQDEQVENSENIPVVNEEEVDSLKADEEKKDEEKKEIVNVVPTGRTDPFLPLRKYTAKQNDVEVKVINSIDYDSVKLPFATPKSEDISKQIDKLMSISVSGIMYDKQKSSAIITYKDNDYFVVIGDKLDQYRVVGIGPDYVKISYGKNIYTAKVGEEFTIDKFYGNNPINNGSRQYYSSQDEYNSLNGIKPKDYTSGNDVKIYSK